MDAQERILKARQEKERQRREEINAKRFQAENNRELERKREANIQMREANRIQEELERWKELKSAK